MPSERADRTSHRIIGAAMRVHSVLGPGLLEHAYRGALAHELRLHGTEVREEVSLPVRYRGFTIPRSYRLDLLVENEVIVEVKAAQQLPPVARAQLLSYLRLSERELGLLINFHAPRIKDGLVRVVNSFTPDYFR
jgi:GxxExxY protein